MPRVYTDFRRFVYLQTRTGQDILKINGSFNIKAPRQKVWDTLNDVEALKQIIPGVQSMKQNSEDEYSARMRVGIGPIKADFNGKVAITERDEPHSYRLSVDGNAKQGWMKGSGTVELHETEVDNTKATIDAEVQVGGMIARVGQRMIPGVSKQLMQSFFKALERVASKR